MTSWLGSIGLTAGGLMLRNLLSSEPNPNKVLDVKSVQYSDRNVHCRDDALVLYISKNNSYEIVLQRPCTETLHQSFSLYRSKELSDAEIRFLQLKDKLPPLITIAKEVYNLNGIQKLCDILREHPSWTLAHLAAYFPLNDHFQDPLILSILNAPDENTGISPLQLAVKNGNLRTVQQILAAGASLEHLDYEANTVFHYAAATSKEIIQALSALSTKCLNLRNFKGYTPLHMACLADKPDCVKALLRAGADVNIAATEATSSPNNTPPGYVIDFLQDHPNKLYAQDMKFGGTPLHWSCSREVINTLVDMGCDIDSLNFDKRTALHVMVLRHRLDCVVALLSRGARADLGDKEGNTPLHLAAREGNTAVVQALIVFGADLSYRNNTGAMPRHCVNTGNDKLLYILHAVGAPRCPKEMQGCNPGCSGMEREFNGIPPATPPSASTRAIIDQMLTVSGMGVAQSAKKTGRIKGGRLLCLDGGGIRGMILAEILLELEKQAGKSLVQCFDWIAGTSTGGILALGLAAGKTLKECLYIYFRMKDLAFVGARPYSSEPLENMLKECLGSDSVMATVTHPKVMITGVLADRKPVDLHLFRNYPSPSTLLIIEPNGLFRPPPLPEEQLMWRAARATGAAPSYFRFDSTIVTISQAHLSSNLRSFGRFLDGGLIANNPTLDAMTEIHEYNLAMEATGKGAQACPLTLVVSLGTGLVPITQVTHISAVCRTENTIIKITALVSKTDLGTMAQYYIRANTYLKEIDVFRPESLWDTARLAMGMSSLGQLLVDQATASDGRVVDRARAWCSMIGVPYYRFTPQMSEDIAMDERSDEKLVNMLWETRAYTHANRHVLNELVALLNKD
uniref:phospholipase A2 n=1 Tax=Timema douglasi TaxID=61478 RepID=A0A7R8VRN6_TIMDO|nr:unnamed protein product [Timema douglasi]